MDFGEWDPLWKDHILLTRLATVERKSLEGEAVYDKTCIAYDFGIVK